jgi:hypothetical protein
MLGWEGRMRESLFALWVIWAAIVGVSTGYTPLAVAACDPGFTQVNDDGFGDRNNLYAWSMEAFGGYLYVGTLNNIEGPQIWRWDGTTWEEVLRLDVATGNTGFRTMQVFKGWLYASTVNEEQGAELWRTQDGTTWEAVPAAMHGFGDPLNTSFRGMAIFKRQLYLGVQNQSGSGGQLWRTRDGARWRPVNQDGFGDTSNNSVHSLDVFGGMLYAIPLPISPAISADQGLTIPTVDCFRKRHRQQIKHLRPQMGSAAGLMGNGMALRGDWERLAIANLSQLRWADLSTGCRDQCRGAGGVRYPEEPKCRPAI